MGCQFSSSQLADNNKVQLHCTMPISLPTCLQAAVISQTVLLNFQAS